MKRPLAHAIGTQARYLKLRFLAFALLALHLVIRTIFPNPTKFSDVLLYNLVAFTAALVALTAPIFTDRLAALSIFFAIFLWAIASTISSSNSFSTYQFAPSFVDIGYSLFYPLILFGTLRALTSRNRFASIEILDTFIIIFGTSSMIASLLLKSAMAQFAGSSTTVFFSIVYPIGDLVLLAMAVVLVALTHRGMRSAIFLTGILIFTATDAVFLWKSATTGYAFASLLDDGWLLGIALIAESLWHHGSEDEPTNERVSSVAATISLIFTAIVLGVSATRRSAIPLVALLPALLTITLSFIRMALALRTARHAAGDRILARTDELTGLANRRHFLAELAGAGERDLSLLLMDLDGFKAINDTLGHEVGDRLLQQIAIRFQRVTDGQTMLARLGGDEFAAIVYGPPLHGLECAQALRATLSYPFFIDGSAITIDISIGRVINDGNGELLQRADQAMYEAKRGSLGVVLWQP